MQFIIFIIKEEEKRLMWHVSVGQGPSEQHLI